MGDGLTFDVDSLEYTHTGFMQTLRDRKSGVYSPDTTSNDSTKINSLYKDLALDLKDILGYSVSAIVDGAFKNGIRRIEYYRPSDDDIELYKLAKKVNIILSQVYKDRAVFNPGSADALYMYRLAEANLYTIGSDYNRYMHSEINLSDKRSTVRYINDDIISGYNSYFRHIDISQISMLNLIFMAGVSADVNNEDDWSKVENMIPLQYNNIFILFADSAYNAYLNLMNDDIFKRYDE